MRGRTIISVEIHWVDDVLTGGITTLFGGAVGYFAATRGARIGASATRESTELTLTAQARIQKEQFEQESERRAGEIEREHLAWRKALRYECEFNMRQDNERSEIELWSYDTGVLREAFLHAAAFGDSVLERIVRARISGEQVESYLEELRPRRVSPGIERSQHDQLKHYRSQFMGEIIEIEKALR